MEYCVGNWMCICCVVMVCICLIYSDEKVLFEKKCMCVVYRGFFNDWLVMLFSDRNL